MQELMGLAGQPALVVGGGFGTGKELALLLARAGAKVAVADIDRDRAEAVAKEIGGVALTGDVRDEAVANAMVDAAAEALGGLTRVANIVGQVKNRRFAECDADHIEAQWRMNLHSQMNIAQAAGRHMRAGTGGSIAMVASVSGIYGARNHVPYGMAKAAVMAMARGLADEWGPFGIRINCIAPDINATPRLVNQIPMPEAEALAMMDANAVKEGVPLQRFGRPIDLAKPLLFLLSDMASFITGQTLVIDGGVMVQFPHQAGELKR
ncbi:MAG: SDR family oxidoreductase [Sphingomonadales bacterium]|nr:SDR family oxidoreductase [Sphingomonadales bacterium]